MGQNGHPPLDKIDPAVAAAAKSEPLAMRQFQVIIGSTSTPDRPRPAMCALPVDATDAEIGEFAGWILTAVVNAYRADRQTKEAGGLVIARSLPA